MSHPTREKAVFLNKSESKYFNTARKMDEAFLSLLEQKDFPYITVKEICARAGVHRSTFYLHYETVNDLLTESISYLNEHFFNYMEQNSAVIVTHIHDCPLRELYWITPEYLTPYLNYIKEHRRLIQTALKHSSTLQLEQTYLRMFRHVFTPILARFQIPAQQRSYLMAFYIQGLMGIITQWLNHDCADPVEHVIRVIQRCIAWEQEKQEVL